MSVTYRANKCDCVDCKWQHDTSEPKQPERKLARQTDPFIAFLDNIRRTRRPTQREPNPDVLKRDPVRF